MKTNKNGVKLLAAAMVLVMAFAAFAIVGSDDSYADDITGPAEVTSTIKEAPAIMDADSDASYVVTSDKTVEIGAQDAATTLYVADGVSVTIKGTAGSVVAITVVAMSADGKYYITNDTNVVITKLVSGSITVKAAYSDSIQKASTLYLSGSPTVNSTGGDITATPGQVSGSDNGKIIVGADGLSVSGKSAIITKLSYGSAFDAAETTTNTITYTAPGSNNTFTLASGDKVNISNGTYTVSGGDNTIRFTGFKGTDVVVTGTSAEPTVSGGASGDSAGSITIVKGIIADSSSNITASFVSGKINAVQATADSKLYYINQIPATTAVKIGGEDKTYSAFSVLGTVEQKISTGANALPISVAAKASMIIPENVAIKATTLTTASDSVVRVFGTLTCTTDSSSATAGPVYSGPFGKVSLKNDGSVKADGNTNVTSGDDTGRSGEVSGEIGNAILTGDAVIPSGQTLTVNGYLGLNGKTLTVEGTLVINSNAVVYTVGAEVGPSYEGIVLKSAGKIQNDGSFGTIESISVAKEAAGTNKITLSGVSGAQFAYVSEISQSSKILAIFGDISTSGYVKNETTDVGTIETTGTTAIAKDSTIGAGVTYAGTTDKTFIAAGATVTVDGTIEGEVKLGYGAGVIIDGIGAKSLSIKAYEGAIDGSGKTTSTNDVSVSNSSTEILTGLSVYSVKTTINGIDYVKVYLDGSISDADNTNDSSTPTRPTVIVTGITYISEEGLVVDNGCVLTAGNAAANTVNLEGTIETETTLSITYYTGAYYTVKDGSVTTTFYTTLDVAMDNIASAQNKTVTAKVVDLNDEIVVSAGQVLSITVSNKVVKGASIVVEKDARATISIANLVGSVTVYKGANCTPTFTNAADAIITSEEKTVYAGFVTALEMASAGETLTVGSVTSEESLIVKDGISLIADSMTITGNLSIPETSSLKASSITINGPNSQKAKVDVAGTLDLSAGSITGNYELKSTGKTILASVNSTTMSGAYYTATQGLILTTVSNAAKDATSGEIVIVGKVSEKSDITLSGVDLRIPEGSEAVLANVTLDNAKVISQGKVTAIIIDAVTNETTTGANAASVSLGESKITIQDNETGLQINNIDGKVNVLSGVVTVAGAAVTTANSEFTVSKGAQTIVSGSLTAQNGKMTVNGDMDVKGTFTSTITPAINGTLTAIAGATVSMTGANIAGSLIAEDSTAFTINGSGFVVLATGEVAGEFTFTGTKYVKVMTGADVEDMDLGATVATTTFYVNGDALETYYTIGTTTLATVEASILADVNAIPELQTSSALTWKQADGTAAPTNLGDVSELYTTVGLATVKVTVSVGTGISMWVDGIKYASGSEADLIIGEHNVSATINPGYKGTTTITFNGATVSNGKIAITADMIGGTNEVLSVTGNITIDSGDTPVTPVEPEKKDGGMGITDYLLIVLVILAAILVVIVAIRMMRS